MSRKMNIWETNRKLTTVKKALKQPVYQRPCKVGKFASRKCFIYWLTLNIVDALQRKVLNSVHHQLKGSPKDWKLKKFENLNNCN